MVCGHGASGTIRAWQLLSCDRYPDPGTDPDPKNSGSNPKPQRQIEDEPVMAKPDVFEGVEEFPVLSLTHTHTHTNANASSIYTAWY